jgi:ferredoxin
MKKPDIDIGACTLCMGCVESCPEAEYPEQDVDEAIMFCPEDCIAWSEK